MSTSWPMIGRAGERALIVRAMTSRTGATLVVRGGSGVGKTRLAFESTRALAMPVFWVTADDPGRQIPLGAFAEWVDPSGSDPLARVTSLLTTFTQQPHQLVVIDDASRLDNLSLFVLSHLIRETSVSVLLTLRDGDPAAAALIDMLSWPEVTSVTLHPLSRTECDEFVRSGLGATPDAAVSAKLWNLSEGNPLFLISLIESSRAAGSLTINNGKVIVQGSFAPDATLSAALRTRMSDAAPAVADVIDLLSLAEPLPLTVLTALAGSPAVEEAEKRRFIHVGDGDAQAAVRLAHPLYGEISRMTAGGARTQRLRGELAQQLDKFEAVNLKTQIVKALLVLDTPDLAGRDRFLLQGAEAALTSLDLSLALQLSTAVAPDGEYASEARAIAGYALSLSSQGDAAEATLVGQDAPVDSEVAATTTFIRAANKLWTMGDAVGAERIARSPRTPADTRNTILGICQAMSGHPSQARRILEAVGGDTLPGLGLLLSSWAQVVIESEIGTSATVDARAAAGYETSHRSEFAAHQQSPLAYFHAYALSLLGDLPSTARLIDTRLPEPGTVPPMAEGWAAGIRGLHANACGDPNTAVGYLDLSLQLLDAPAGPDFMWIQFAVERAYAAALSGDSDGLSHYLDMVRSHPHPAFTFLDYRVLTLDAWSAAVQGSLTAGIDHARRAAELAAHKGQPMSEVYALQTGLRMGDTSGAPRLAELAAHLSDNPRATAAARHADAAATGDPDALASAAEHYAGLGMIACAADCFAQAAQRYQRAGRTGSRLTATERLSEIAHPRGLATPSLISALHPDDLTDRQREVLTLANKGVSHQDIARALHLSVRTVEGHLYRARRRLDARP